MRTWLVGSGEHAHPVLRWLDVPLFRASMLIFTVVMFVGTRGHGWTVWKAATLGALGLSILAGVVNAAVLWRRRRKADCKTS
jgi:hypothetical protein